MNENCSCMRYRNLMDKFISEREIAEEELLIPFVSEEIAEKFKDRIAAVNEKYAVEYLKEGLLCQKKC